jgi:hypothetical protein
VLTGVSGCYLGGESGVAGMLLADPDYGTSLNGKPVMWPVGFTGVRVGSELVVLNSAGTVIAKTGSEYYISIGPVDSQEKQRLIESIGAFTAAANCPYPWDLIDCGSPAPSQRDVAEAKCRSH